MLAFCVAFCVGGVFALAADAPPPKQTILFFDPDANHEAIIPISGWFNQFLQEAGLPLRFQPVQGFQVFTAMLKEEATQYVIVSSQFLGHPEASGLQPLLVPSSGGDVYYRKVLLDRGAEGPADLKSKTIAMTTGSGQFKEQSERLVQNLRPKGREVDRPRFLQVSKDVDALLALAFSRVDAAIVTPTSVDVLKRINPKTVESFRVVTETERVLRAPLCRLKTTPTNPALEQRLLALFKKMADSDPGKKAMRSLTFDSWVDFDPGMIDTKVVRR